jgi:hypothetical protein
MPGKSKTFWIVLAVVVALGISAVAALRYRRRPLTISGAVTVQDSDPRKQLPISDVVVRVANDFAARPTKTDSSGFFSIRLFKHVRRGEPMILQFQHPGYQTLDLHEVVSDDLYVAQMKPIRPEPEPGPKKPAVKIANIVVRYSFKTLRSVDVGSAVNTFEVVNQANVRCNHGPICSPDGTWKANIGKFSLNAGPGNEFHDARLSCIAGPCPFTKVVSDNFSKGGQTITASVLGWSDTTTFLVEAEVTHFMVSQLEHKSYPVIFGPTLNFTLPADAEGVSLEADMAGQSIVFPLGPDLLLSWANCSAAVNKDLTKVYRCELKPGYQFQS